MKATAIWSFTLLFGDLVLRSGNFEATSFQQLWLPEVELITGNQVVSNFRTYTRQPVSAIGLRQHC
jgi:hypothetical protein